MGLLWVACFLIDLSLLALGLLLQELLVDLGNILVSKLQESLIR